MIDELFALADQASRTEDGEPQVVSETFANNEQCINCGGPLRKLRDYSTVCIECGIHDDRSGRIDEGPEWSSMVDDNGSKDNSRCGMPQNPLFNEWGRVGSVIGNVKGASYQQKRLQKISSYVLSNHKDRSLNKVYHEIQDACAIINLPPNIVELAKFYYKKVSEKGITRGAVRRAMKANCVYFACINEGYPRSDNEIASIFGLESRDHNKIYRRFRECLGEDYFPRGEGAQASNIIPNIISKLDSSIGGRTMCNIVSLCTMVETNMNFVGKVSHGIAGACILYVIGDEYLDAVSEATHISKNTLIRFKAGIDELVNITAVIEDDYRVTIKEPSGNVVVLPSVSGEKEALDGFMKWLSSNRNGRRVTILCKNKYKNSENITFKLIRLKNN